MKIAIVGRPNVGKSTLFNRLLGKRIAIVDKVSGTTRDRIYGELEWNNRRMTIIDTGGIEFDENNLLKQHILEQIKISIKEAALVIFVTDVTQGIVPMDVEISKILRRDNKKVIIAVNKVDNEKLTDSVPVFSSLGWDNVIGVSAAHGISVNKLLDEIVNILPNESTDKAKEPSLKIAIVGRPNVGKSTFVNAVLNENRMIISEIPGTTRDAVDVKFNINGQVWLFIDTAGMRKRKKVKQPLEYYSVTRAFLSIERADVVVLMVDAWQGIWKQDAQILDYIIANSKPCIIAINKWDLVTKVSKKEYIDRVSEKLSEYQFIPAVFISSLKKENIGLLLNKINDVFKQAHIKVSTKVLNKLLQTLKPTRKIKIYYGTQSGVNPPNYLLFVNNSVNITKQYINYISNNIRKQFKLEVPIKISLRSKNKKHD